MIMKRLIVILFVMIPFIGNAQFFDYSASVETGYINSQRSIKGYVQESYAGSNFYESTTLEMYHPKLSFYSDLQVGVHFFNRLINFKTNILTTFSKDNGINFTPLLTNYITNLYYDPDLPIKIGWKHNCIHTIAPTYLNDKIYNSSYDQIYIKLTIKQ
jgi:hypothetical protein